MTGLRLLVLTVLFQLIGFGAGSVALDTLQSLPIAYLAHATIAFLGARIFHAPRPWQLLNLLLPLILALTSEVALPRTLLFATAAILFLIYIPTFWTRVPYYPTSDPMYEVLLRKLPKDRPFTFIDLGCGFGRLLAFLADRAPLGQFEGVEIGVLPYLVSKIRSLRRPNVTIRFQSFWQLPFARYDFVYAFLAPGPMPALWAKAQREMRHGTTFLTNTFAVPAEPTSTESVDDSHRCALFEHVM